MESEKSHWENIYRTKDPADLSWTQACPSTSLDFIHNFHLPRAARIIDIGGGDSLLADHLLDEGYTDITVLDISGAALQRAQKRLGNRAYQVHWIEEDITRFQPNTAYDLWHDRATFHFLITEAQIHTYLSIARHCVQTNRYIVIGTFSDQGPDKCSGLAVRQYSEDSLTQQFTFCSFKRLPMN